MNERRGPSCQWPPDGQEAKQPVVVGFLRLPPRSGELQFQMHDAAIGHRQGLVVKGLAKPIHDLERGGLAAAALSLIHI